MVTTTSFSTFNSFFSAIYSLPVNLRPGKDTFAGHLTALENLTPILYFMDVKSPIITASSDGKLILDAGCYLA
jgi:hypothetical protein